MHSTPSLRCMLQSVRPSRMFRPSKDHVISLIVLRYIGSLNGCVGSDVDPENWPKILELIQAEKTVGWQDKKLMEESTHRYMNSPVPVTAHGSHRHV